MTSSVNSSVETGASLRSLRAGEEDEKGRWIMVGEGTFEYCAGTGSDAG